MPSPDSKHLNLQDIKQSVEQNENQANNAVSKRRTNEKVKEVLGDEGIKAGQGKKSQPRKQCPSLKK